MYPPASSWDTRSDLDLGSCCASSQGQQWQQPTVSHRVYKSSSQVRLDPLISSNLWYFNSLCIIFVKFDKERICLSKSDAHVNFITFFLCFLRFFVSCSEKEAAVMRANSWLYQFYSLHSKMHFGLTYEATTRLSSFYSPGSGPPTGLTGHHSYSTGTPGSPGTSPDSNHSSSVHSLPHHHPHHPMHPYHPHAIHASLGSLHGHPSSHHYTHPHLQYSPQPALPYPSLTGLSVATSPGSESDSSHQTSLKGAHPSFPFFPSSAAAFVCLCWSVVLYHPLFLAAKLDSLVFLTVSFPSFSSTIL